MSKFYPVEIPEKVTPNSLIRDMSDMLKPPLNQEVWKTARQHLVLSSGGAHGKYDPDVAPYMKEPMECVRDREHRLVIMCGSARSGKSIALVEGTMTHTILASPGDMLMLFPDINIARRFAKLRIDRAIQNSPKLKEKLSASAHSDNVLSKQFRHGMGLEISHPSPSALSANDYKICIISDHDRRKSDDNAEGSIIAQAMKRNATYGSLGCTIVESSPGRDLMDSEWRKSEDQPHAAPPVGGIMSWYNDGDRRLYNWECPHCHDPILLYPSFDLFMLPNDDVLIDEIVKNGALATSKKYAHIYCTSCGSRIEHKHKHEMNLGGYWERENGKISTISSFWQSGLMARFTSWENILEKYFSALSFYTDTGEDSKIKAVLNTDIGIPHVPMALKGTIDLRSLINKAKNFERGVVPKEARYLIACIDVQMREFVVQVIAHGVNDEKWIVDRYNIRKSNRNNYDEAGEAVEGSYQLIAPATYLEDWDLIEEQVLNKRYPMEDDELERGMLPCLVLCDSAGMDGVTENAYKFWLKMNKTNQTNRFKLIKGMENSSKNSVMPFIDKRKIGKDSSASRKAKTTRSLYIWALNSNLLKDAVIANLKMDNEPGSNCYNTPDWLGKWWYEQILAEKREKNGWSQIKKRNETFDLLYYDKAGTMIMIHDHYESYIDWERPPSWADIWDNNIYVDNIHVEMANDAKKKRKVRKPIMKMSGGY